jgi:hypothetical protein
MAKYKQNFKSESEAKKLCKQLKGEGFKPSLIFFNDSGQNVYTVEWEREDNIDDAIVQSMIRADS